MIADDDLLASRHGFGRRGRGRRWGSGCGGCRWGGRWRRGRGFGCRRRWRRGARAAGLENHCAWNTAE